MPTDKSAVLVSAAGVAAAGPPRPPLFSPDDRRLAALNGVMLAVALVLIGVNAVFFRYTGIFYFPRLFWPLVPPLLLVLAYGLRIRRSRPDLSFVLVTMSFYLATMITQAVLATGIQYAPFPPIDAALARWDAALGFNVAAVLPWTYAHPPLERLLWRCYDSVDAQLALVPLLACILQDRRRMRTYMYAVIYSFLLGGLFYYFFPSSGPAGVFQSPYFAPAERMTHIKFYHVHHFEAVTTMAGGLIAFPSFHVAWGVLLPYLGRSRRWAFYPLLALNALMVAATVLLGWHFLVDVAGGLGLALLSLRLGDRTRRRLESASAA